jgi:hypothetical protein
MSATAPAPWFITIIESDMDKSKINLWLLFAAAGMAVFIGYAAFEAGWTEITETIVHGKNVPPEFIGKRIVFVADIHCGEGFPVARMGALIEQLNSLNADIVIFGGDYVSRNGEDTKACFAKLAGIKAPLGKYGVLGNHDIEAGKKETISAMENAGITLLFNNNRRITIGGGQITVAGTDETWYGLPDGMKAMEGATDFTIYTTHDPSYFEKYQNDKAKLLLAGHTHGGQITFFGIPFSWLVHRHKYRYEKGIYEESGRTVIVTNGIGATILPLRFFARPQINVIILEK